MALDIVELIKITLGVLHTFVRFLPLDCISSVIFQVYYLKTVVLQLFWEV